MTDHTSPVGVFYDAAGNLCVTTNYKRIAGNEHGFTRIMFNAEGWPCAIVHVEHDEDPILAQLKLRHDKAFHSPGGCQVAMTRAEYNAITDHSDNHYLLARALYPKVLAGDYLEHPDAPAHPALADRLMWQLRKIERRRSRPGYRPQAAAPMDEVRVA